MVYKLLMFAYRKPGITPEQFKAYYDTIHAPLIRELAGPAFPLSHTRRYIHRSEGQSETNTARNPNTPASVLVGTQGDFDYDAISELIFEDEDAFKAFYAITMAHEVNGPKIAADAENFIDSSRMPAVVLSDTSVTQRE
ncbi:EthD domain-containing protein [Xylaria arbuscula]|uniref:EthD domain-containing protein n=1 Tax=Xylaria arbuscula TaxID=114810 RepID=A0A9W8NKR0_9PEZI|nr:EthD domain-containing protein [Xylaria arbuscula]KAJ3578745.1 hypothetical protein NPX13_g1820 [Xylaria arbuscula]